MVLLPNLQFTLHDPLFSQPMTGQLPFRVVRIVRVVEIPESDYLVEGKYRILQPLPNLYEVMFRPTSSADTHHIGTLLQPNFKKGIGGRSTSRMGFCVLLKDGKAGKDIKPSGQPLDTRQGSRSFL